MEQCGFHERFSATCFGVIIAWGITAIWGGVSVFTVGAGVDVGVERIDQSFLVSNRLSEADPALGQGVICLTGGLGMSSSHGGWEFWVMSFVLGPC